MAFEASIKLKSVYVLILIVVPILKAQTGSKCFFRTCPITGQVRIDASFDINGNFLGGCHCACDPSLTDEFSPNYCPEPIGFTINFDPIAMTGDCACIPPPAITTNAPSIAPSTTSAPSSLGCPIATYIPCSAGQVRLDPIYDQRGNFLGGCNCGCDTSLSDPLSINHCAPPRVVNFDPVQFTGDCACVLPTETTVNTPTTTITPNPNGLDPPVSVQVVCDMPGTCECPAGHHGPCDIICDGPEVCIEHPINCNNNGYDCTVQCLSESACEGSTVINGPVGGSLTVNCLGDFACEGGTVFNGDKGLDLTVMCHGSSSCAEATFNFGAGRGVIGCHGRPEACAGAQFHLPPNSVATEGVSFTCLGLFCPPNAPAAFSNTFGNVTKTCSDPGDCSCPPGTKGKCTIRCESNADACADALIECNNDGYPCIVHCNGAQSCSGASAIMGPADASLTVYCKGNKACEGETSFDASSGTDLNVVCAGGHACNGDIQFNFGKGSGLIQCIGQPDACGGPIVFILPRNAAITPGIAFACVGDLCPLHAPAPFNNVLHLSSGPEMLGFCFVPSVTGLMQWQGI
eukprot:30608_1